MQVLGVQIAFIKGLIILGQMNVVHLIKASKGV